MMSKKTRKICVVINNRANYARIKYFLKFAKKIKNIDLHIIVVLPILDDRRFKQSY